MAGRQAKVISTQLLRRMLAYAKESSSPQRDRVIVLLSCKAGLRACEIARLEWSMVLDARGKVAGSIAVRDAISKNGAGRNLPMQADLREALVALRKLEDCTGPIVRSWRGGGMRPNSIMNWFVTLFDALGVEGCSSHSGRRTFITAAARNAHRAGCSLRDEQLLAGHRSIGVTQRYIDGDTDAQRRLVRLL